MPKFFIIYYLFFNLLLFLFMGWDKYRAQKGLLRISEGQLYTLALLGGPLGGLLGMKAFHHKSRKPAFKLIFGISLLIHGIIVLWLLDVIKISFQ